MDSGLHCPADTPTFSFIGLCDSPMGGDANEIRHSVKGNPQIFSFFSIYQPILDELYLILSRFFVNHSQKPTIKEKCLCVSGVFQVDTNCSCLPLAWMIPDLWPSLQGLGEAFFTLGLGWGLDDRWAEGRKCKPIHIRPHLDLKRRLFMHDRNKSSTLHIHLARPQCIDH